VVSSKAGASDVVIAYPLAQRGRGLCRKEALIISITHRLFAALYDRMNAAAERRWMGERRANLLAGASGVVLEIGGGTGANLPYYRAAVRVVIAEPDPFMRKKLRPKLAQAHVPVEVSNADAQRLPFADESFDTVVSTLVFCTIPDPQAALMEIRRVLHPVGGRLLFLEHVRGEGRVARWQDRVQPLWSWLIAGCHPNRDTVATIETSSFRLEKLERFEPPAPLSVFAPCVQGAAYVIEEGRE
jgi:ubiquinone/menaquinone biosynthesis C-methylase UbiE